MPDKMLLFLEKFKLVLYAQNGMKAELQGYKRCGGWLTSVDSSPVKCKKEIYSEKGIFLPVTDMSAECVLLVQSLVSFI